MRQLTVRNRARISESIAIESCRDRGYENSEGRVVVSSGLADQFQFWMSSNPLAGQLTLRAIAYHLRAVKDAQ